MLAVAAILMALPAGIQAQSTWDLTFGAGISNPVSDLNDSWNIGASATGAATYWFQDRLGFRVETAVDFLSGEAISGTQDLPDMNLWHFGAGLEYAVTDRASNALSVIVNGGGGLTLMDGDDAPIAGQIAKKAGFSQTYGQLNGGLSIGWPLSESVTVAVTSSVYFTFADKNDTATIPGVINPFDTAITFPVGVTLRFHL